VSRDVNERRPSASVRVNPSDGVLWPNGRHTDLPAPLLDDLAALYRAQRRGVAKGLRKVAETFAGVPDGRHTAHTLRLLAHFLDPTAGQ
jgi:hypothetical protein